jgi:hypothetical protein
VKQETALGFSIAIYEGGHIAFDLMGSRHGGTIRGLQQKIVLELPPIARRDFGALESGLQAG